ncbi:hypothetical protein ILUMI_24152 [Ignelater luminosus]|uniref:Uncharacterized protein n=1 Tax=Ignelater luminosus TaxID=2038154 RepID=A0A8K0FZ09_IGNLU|nr:hypothetical protein ILUMI_24152 [Ignelater luminosus]
MFLRQLIMLLQHVIKYTCKLTGGINFTMGVLRKMQTRKLLISCILIMLVFVIILLIRGNTPLDERDRQFRLEKIDELIKTHASFEACKQPHLPVDSPEIMKFVKDVKPIDCSSAGFNWVVCEDSECKIQEQAMKQYGKIKCSFTDMIRQDDFYVSEGETTTSETSYKLEKSDVVKVSCKSETGDLWKGTLTGIRMDKRIWDRTGWNFVPEDALKLNILMFGFDSLSRNTFIRKLPKSYKYLTEILQGHVLQGYNIVGDGTPQALIPILTGQTELELPDTRKRIAKTNYVNVYPFIWNEYKDAGYVTGFLEDVPNLGTFTYRLRGFNEPPTDHYMRPYYIATLKEWARGPRLCAGSIPRHKVMMDHIKHFFSAYKEKPKFIFGFHGELSHDSYNLVGVADDDLLQFLKDLNESGALHDTLLILMADHGHRFADIRNTIQGKQEERLPFFSFTFPQWFKKEHKQAYENFVGNINKLTTPFDIFATLKSVLHYDSSETANLEHRSLSLFTKVPSERSCAHAYIEPHWCACLEWNSVPLSEPLVQQLGNVLVNTLNNYTSTHRHLCAVLSVSQIFWVTKTRPNENLIKFYKNADLDGFIADMSSKMKIKNDIYQIKAMLTPGDSLFEASITHYFETNKLELKLSDISRINMYGRQARCIEDDFPNLRKYCYCKD